MHIRSALCYDVLQVIFFVSIFFFKHFWSTKGTIIDFIYPRAFGLVQVLCVMIMLMWMQKWLKINLFSIKTGIERLETVKRLKWAKNIVQRWKSQSQFFALIFSSLWLQNGRGQNTKSVKYVIVLLLCWNQSSGSMWGTKRNELIRSIFNN